MKEINILYLSDNNYAVFAGVSIVSLFENNKHFDKISVYVIDDNISSENKFKMQSVAEKYGREIVFLDMTSSKEKLQKLGAPKYRNSYTTYLKLFTFGILPDTVDKIFFIDSDSVVVGPLDELLDYNMNGNPIAAVKDAMCRDYMMSFGFPDTDSWYNMGIMLVDTKKWRENECEEKIINQLKKRTGYVAVDQDLLNITVHGNISTLHPKFNSTPQHYVYGHRFMKSFPQKDFYDEKTMDESVKNPVIKHFERFIGESPWHKNTVHPYRDEFDKYLAISPWKDYEKSKANVNSTLKIEKLLFKILPHSLFVPIFAFFFKRYFKKTSENLEKGSITNITV